jgi:putative ABC transport system permease protein
MQLKDIAINNLRRRKTKMIFMVFGMVFGIATIVTLFTITSAMEAGMNKKFQEAGLKVAVTPKTNSLSFAVGGITVASGVSYDVKEIRESAVDQIKKIKDIDKVRVISPKVLGTAEINKKKVLVAGIDFSAELKIRSWWNIVTGGRQPEKDNEVLIGSRLAMVLKKQPGEEITVKGQSFKISGVLEETGSDEDSIIFMQMAAAQKLLKKENVYSFIEINTVRDEEAMNRIIGEIAEQLPDARVKQVKEANESRKELVERFAKFSLVVSLIMLLIGSLIVMTTMMSSVNERTREIGIFRAIGFRKSHVMRIILLEAGIVSGLSGVIGYLAGMGAAIVVAPFMDSMKLAISWNPLMGIAVVILAVLTGVLASIYPATRASKLDPAEALRFI